MRPFVCPDPATALPDDETLHLLAVALTALRAAHATDPAAYHDARARFVSRWLALIARASRSAASPKVRTRLTGDTSRRRQRRRS